MLNVIRDASTSTNVEITRVEAIPLRLPFKAPFKMPGIQAERSSIDVLIVKIHTSEGVVGIGETQAWRRQGSAEILPNLAYLVEEIFQPLMIGRSPFDLNAIVSLLDDCVYNSLYAQAAVGDALYDVAGRLLNVPVYDLLGGKCRDRIRVGTILSMTTSPEALIEEAQEYYARGYRHMRLKIGMDPGADVRNLDRLRSHFGSKIVIRADANASMRFDTALRLLQKFEPYDLDAVEQPVPLWDLDGLAALSRAVRIPVAADEALSTDHSLIEIIRRRAAAMIQTKIAKNGGILGCRRLWTIAGAAGLGIFPGNHSSTSIATASVAHLCASWPGPLCEGDFAHGILEVLASDIVTSPVRFENGEIVVPDGPGLGIELDEEKVAAYRVAA